MALAWEVESLRISIFSNSPTAIGDEDWRALAGEVENYTRQTIAGGKVFTGKIDTGEQLTFSGVLKRIDIAVSIEPSGTSFSDERLPTIGPWDSVCDRFVKLTSAWLRSSEIPIVRLAFGAVLLCPALDKQASYILLQDLLNSVSVDPDNMQDLLFRVNWPRSSKTVDGLLVNRLTTWSAIQVLLASIELGIVPSATRVPQANAVRLEIDHNTDASRSEPFIRSNIIPIYEELVSNAAENVERGECP